MPLPCLQHYRDITSPDRLPPLGPQIAEQLACPLYEKDRRTALTCRAFLRMHLKE